MRLPNRAIPAALAATALLSGAAVWAAAPASAGTTYTFSCSSTAGTSEGTFSMTGTAPATVVQGSEFELTDVVATGTTDIDLWLKSMTIVLDAPAGATPLDGLSRTFVGPAATDPPGPVAPAGSTNSSPPRSFRFTATGPVGSTVEFVLGRVDSVPAQIGNPAVTLEVTCTRVAGGAFASTVIVAPPVTTSTTSTSTTTTPSTTATTSTTPVTTGSTSGPSTTGVSAQVLGAGQVLPTAPVAASVAVQPAYAG